MDTATHAPTTLRLPQVTAATVGLGSIGIVALHVVDDNFLQPEPGVSPVDHLAGGSIQLALLGLAAVAYHRGRAGLRAAVALVAGVMALVIGGASAGHSTVTVGPSGDDYTGLLAIPAGLVLIAIGAHTLWSSRKRGGSRTRRYLRRGLIAVATVFAAPILFQFAFSYVITQVMRQSVPTPQLGVPHEDVSFTTSDGLELQGWYVPSKNGAAVIAFPGRSGPQAHTRMLVRHGYGVLLFDRRGEGRSEGDSNLLGWGGSKDIHAAVEFLQGRSDVAPDRIGGIGLSVGGELMLQAAAETDGLAAVVSEGAGTRTFGEQMQEYDGLELVLGAPGIFANAVGTALFSSSGSPPDLTELAPKIEQPLFVIWAPNGGNLEHMSERYYELARGPKQIWEMPTAKHVKGIYEEPLEYERRVVGFFDDALLGK
jgi:uncharacterized protein